MIDLTNKVAIVTGGGKGIGESVCHVLAKQGATVHVLDIDKENGKRVAKTIQQNKANAFFHHCDLTNHEKVGELFQSIFNRSKSLDILINNAGVAHIGNVENTTPQDMDKIYNVNVKSVYSCLHFAIPLLKKSGGGSIVNMASVASLVGLADRFAYTASKGAVYSLTFSIAKDYVAYNIRCNAVGPGRVHTPFVDNYLNQNYPGKETEMFEKLSKTQPIGRMGKPNEIASLIAYLCSDEAAFVTGSFYPIDGGFLTLNT
ncbi:SDR family NAD(P)-dependent oxidoreductase [Changchengzhania lutea]|uniref:SDR family NAD(P)-dependent oxidoreductase n=1 Tax=Changchengzhania lutea TaxID=2049305 RepID=UPI00115F19A9|nr:SDR family oxidoreductase [Changchengzhania lutea]